MTLPKTFALGTVALLADLAASATLPANAACHGGGYGHAPSYGSAASHGDPRSDDALTYAETGYAYANPGDARPDGNGSDE